MPRLGFSCKRCVHLCGQDEKARAIFKGNCDKFETMAHELAKNNAEITDVLGLELENRRLEIMKHDWQRLARR